MPTGGKAPGIADEAGQSRRGQESHTRNGAHHGRIGKTSRQAKLGKGEFDVSR